MFLGIEVLLRNLVKSIFLYLVLIPVAICCSVVPEEGEPDWSEFAKRDSVRYLVQKSEIYLATAVSKETTYNHMAKFTLQVNETLRGSTRQEIQLVGGDLDYKKDLYKNSFHDRAENHEVPEFWAFLEDSGADFGDCQNRGFYRIGQQYLIFLNEEALRRSFEPTRSEQDLWLNTIRDAATFVNYTDEVSDKK